MNFIFANKYQKKFINLTKNFFDKKKVNINNQNQILVEFNPWPHFHIILSYVANILSDKHKSKIVAYFGHKILINTFKEGFFFRLKWFLSNYLSIKTFAVYKSFNTNRFLNPNFSDDIVESAKKSSKKILKKINTNYDIEEIFLDDIWLGDLLYDSYLKAFECKTIDLKKDRFKIFLTEFLKLYYFWKKYFKNNKIKAVVASHGVYSLAIPLRIAIKHNIPAYIPDWDKIQYLKKSQNLFQKRISGIDIHYKEYKKILKKNKINIKTKYEEIKKNLNLRLEGKSNDLYYMGNMKKKITLNKFVNKNNKIKVVIYCHTFFDSPHVFGKNLFPDYKIWLDFLENIMKKTDYMWFIKSHPNSDKKTDDYMKLLSKRNPNLIQLPKNFSPKNISNLGIRYALTIYGTVGSELPLYNIIVINASLNNPHIDYKFNLHPKSIFEYEKLLINLKKIKLKIKKNDIYEHYYLKHFYFHNKWIFDDFNKMKESLNNGKDLYNHKIYNYWSDRISTKRHKEICENLLKYFKSEEHRLL
jgi:hypothetical protein